MQPFDTQREMQQIGSFSLEESAQMLMSVLDTSSAKIGDLQGMNDNLSQVLQSSGTPRNQTGQQ